MKTVKRLFSAMFVIALQGCASYGHYSTGSYYQTYDSYSYAPVHRSPAISLGYSSHHHSRHHHHHHH